MGGDRKTFVRLPKKWWPAHWHDIDDPVCELILALYGHPRAGECWYERISGVLFAHGFWCIPEWPCVFINNEDPKNIVVFTLYVDDLIMLGRKHMCPTIASIRKEIMMDDPAPFIKYLGCHPVFIRDVKEQVAGYLMQMFDFISSSCDVYTENNGLSLRGAETPYAPELPKEQTIKLMETPGLLGGESTFLRMKPLYGVRVARPDLYV